MRTKMDRQTDRKLRIKIDLNRNRNRKKLLQSSKSKLDKKKRSHPKYFDLTYHLAWQMSASCELQL